MAGVEDIAGQKGHNSVRDAYERLNAKVLRPLLVKYEKRRRFDASKIVRAYTKITLREALEVAKGGKRFDTPEQGLKRSQSAIMRPVRSTYDNFSYLPDDSSEDSPKRKESALKDELNKYMSSEENTEALYKMFSSLLDRKMREMNASPRTDDSGSDIEDDYMREIIKPPPDVSASTTNVTDTPSRTRTRFRSLANVYSVDVENPPQRRGNVERSKSTGQVLRTDV